MVNVIALVVGSLQTNCFLLVDKDNMEAIIIDPGDDSDYIIDTLISNNLTPTKILLTHGHYDHCLGAEELRLAFDLEVYVHPNDKELVRKAVNSALYFDKNPDALAPKVTHEYVEGDKITHGNFELTVIETPGHTPGGVSLVDYKKGIAFVGDLIFMGGGIGRTDFSYSSHKDLILSIQKILALPDEFIVFSGHGESTTVGHEREFLKEVVLQN